MSRLRNQDLLGRSFGRWIVVSGPSVRPHQGRMATMYWVSCSCGKLSRLVRASALVSGGSKSCGCVRDELAASIHTRHGGRYSPEYAAWMGMIDRCENPKMVSYRDYGGRGISVCERWRHSFASFREDVGPRPSSRHSLDRVDCNGNYEPGNVRWATSSQQNRNRRNNRIVCIFGESMCVVAAAERYGVSARVLYWRLARGMSPEAAVVEPVRRKRAS